MAFARQGRRKNLGQGGYFRGGLWIPITWGHKISERIKSGETKHFKDMTCQHCGKAMVNVAMTKWCSRQCQYQASKASGDEFYRKARTSGSGIRLGKGKFPILAQMFRDAFGKPCVYCGALLSLTNCHIDHIVPVTGIRGTVLAKHLDQRENLQIICRRCNLAKGEMSDGGFKKLLAFLQTDPEIHKAVWRKMGMSSHGWKAIRNRSR